MSEQSVFYKSASRPVALTFLALEHLSLRRQQLEETQNTSITLAQVLKEAIALCGFPEPSDPDLVYLISRINSTAEERKEHGDKVKLQANKHFAGALSEWLVSLTPDKAVIWLSNYDIDLARQLYYTTDVEEVSALISIKMEETFQLAKVRYEASLFGFGGGYGKSHGPNTTVHNLRANASPEEEADALQSLKALGF
jgi:hypothetical protein